MRGGRGLAAGVSMLALLAACASASPTPVPSPPTISAVGVATDERIFADHVSYTFADGSVHDVPTSTRQVADGPAGLVIIGSDTQCPFVAAFPTQGGLPPDCYRENAAGIERGDYVETRGILWAKAPDFTSPSQPALGAAYPSGARFCFNASGQISGVVLNGEDVKAVRFDSWTFSADRRSITVDFAGGPELDLDNPCTVDYHGAAKVDGDELAIGIYPDPFPGGVPENLACESMGFARSLTLSLPVPFHGARLRDLAGQLFFLQRPPGLVRIGGLPTGWVLRSEESLPSSPTGRWSRVFAPPGRALDSGNPGGQVELIQAFGAPANVTGGDLQPGVKVNGQAATFYFWEPAGEMVLVWMIGDDGVALTGNTADFSKDAFLALAAAIGR